MSSLTRERPTEVWPEAPVDHQERDAVLSIIGQLVARDTAL